MRTLDKIFITILAVFLVVATVLTYTDFWSWLTLTENGKAFGTAFAGGFIGGGITLLNIRKF